MTEFVPSGYINVQEALNVIGRELFPSAWTGDEHRARAEFSSPDQEEIKYAPRGSGTPGSGPGPSNIRWTRAAGPHEIRNPADRAYQADHNAIERYSTARHELRVRLESDRLSAVILDYFTGTLHPVPRSWWRRHDADQMIVKNEARIPFGRNTGKLLVRAFGHENAPAKPLPAAKMREAIEHLKARGVEKGLTRRQQADLVRGMFPDCHITTRQMRDILQSIPVPIGRPKKANKKG